MKGNTMILRVVNTNLSCMSIGLTSARSASRCSMNCRVCASTCKAARLDIVSGSLPDMAGKHQDSRASLCYSPSPQSPPTKFDDLFQGRCVARRSFIQSNSTTEKLANGYNGFLGSVTRIASSRHHNYFSHFPRLLFEQCALLRRAATHPNCVFRGIHLDRLYGFSGHTALA